MNQKMIAALISERDSRCEKLLALKQSINKTEDNWIEEDAEL